MKRLTNKNQILEGYIGADIETILTKLSKLRKELKGKEAK